MSYLLFVDESGHDGKDSPYEVLAGVAIPDRDLWNLVCALQEAEVRFFGRRYSEGAGRELKAKRILKRKTFRLAAQLPLFEEEERRVLARHALDHGESAGQRELAALSQAKIAYATHALELCARYRCCAFASVVMQGAPRPAAGHLRKDYVYLFERFFYFLEEQRDQAGLVVFDEREKSESHLLLGQMSNYFQRTTKGRERAGLIIPEPMFVHSDLTTGVQLADLVAYIISWSVRFTKMTAPGRAELIDFARQTRALRHRSVRDLEGMGECPVWSFCYIEDLRPREDRPEDGE